MELISARLGESKTSGKVRSALVRAASGLRLLKSLCGDDAEPPSGAHLGELLGEKAFADAIRRVITNGRSDVHFLPADEQRPGWSGVPMHSVALFRFPLTIPIEVLDTAQRVAEDDWRVAIGRLRGVLPCVDSIPDRPMKRLRLRPRFVSDLLTRYTMMFGRLGSPDFTPDTVSRFVREIQEVR